MTRGGFTIDEVESIYVDPNERYVVSLVVGYSDDDLRSEDPEAWVEMSSEEQARSALRAAYDLTRDEGSTGTVWFVYDRQEKVQWQFEQGEVMDEEEFSL